MRAAFVVVAACAAVGGCSRSVPAPAPAPPAPGVAAATSASTSTANGSAAGATTGAAVASAPLSGASADDGVCAAPLAASSGPTAAPSLAAVPEQALLAAALAGFDAKGGTVKAATTARRGEECRAVTSCRGTTQCAGDGATIRPKVVGRDHVPNRGDYVWIDLGTANGFCPGQRFFVAEVRVDASAVRVGGVAPISVSCTQKPSITPIEFPDGRGLFMKTSRDSEHGGAEIHEVFTADLRPLGSYEVDASDGRPEDGATSTTKTHVSYTAKTIFLDEDVEEQTCATKTSPPTCRVSRARKVHRTLGLVDGKLTELAR